MKAHRRLHNAGNNDLQHLQNDDDQQREAQLADVRVALPFLNARSFAQQ